MTPKKKPAKLGPDAAEIAFCVMQEATGEAPKTLPPKERTTKNADAVKRGAKGGEKGGKARAKKLSPSELGCGHNSSTGAATNAVAV
jgi:hypothetical protein